MTSQEAMENARNAIMNDARLRKFGMSRLDWIATVNNLAAIGIYPDADPRAGPAQEKYLRDRAEETAKGWCYEI